MYMLRIGLLDQYKHELYRDTSLAESLRVLSLSGNQFIFTASFVLLLDACLPYVYEFRILCFLSECAVGFFSVCFETNSVASPLR